RFHHTCQICRLPDHHHVELAHHPVAILDVHAHALWILAPFFAATLGVLLGGFVIWPKAVWLFGLLLVVRDPDADAAHDRASSRRRKASPLAPGSGPWHAHSHHSPPAVAAQISGSSSTQPQPATRPDSLQSATCSCPGAVTTSSPTKTSR